jgi:hypothetical protein
MNGILLEGEALSRCAKSMSAMIHDAASFGSIFDDQQQFEEEERAGRTERQGAGGLFSNAEGSVASEAAVPIVDLLSVRGRCTAAPQFTRAVWALLRALEQLITQLRRLGSNLHNPPITCKSLTSFRKQVGNVTTQNVRVDLRKRTPHQGVNSPLKINP